MKSKWSKYLGPGPLVAAAFIGPGTVTVCTVAGVSYGYDLLWALVLSVMTTIVLQEMASRIGLITQQGLANSIGKNIKSIFWKYISLILVLVAIVLGNAAYEAGNISGGALGVEVFSVIAPIEWGQLKIMPVHLMIGALALALLFSGNYKLVTGFLTVLVVLMSLAFTITAVLVRPDLPLIFSGLVPGLSGSQVITVVALIGTTVVPYNLFLHAGLGFQEVAISRGS
jgi:manganese transport protein